LLDERLSGKPVVVYANKQDLPGAVDEVEIAKGLGLEEMTSSSSRVIKCTALPEKNNGKTDPALKEGLSWLRAKAMSKEINIRVTTDTKAYETKLAQENAATEVRVKEAKEKRRLAKEAKETAEAAGVEAGVTTTTTPPPKPPSAPSVLKCAVVHPVKIWHFTDETSDEKGLALCRKFNEDFTGSVGYQCSQEATCKCSKYKWKPVCEECDKWARDGFPTLNENGPIAVADADADVDAAEEEMKTETKAEEKVVDTTLTTTEVAQTEVVAQNDENTNTANTTSSYVDDNDGKMPPLGGSSQLQTTPENLVSI